MVSERIKNFFIGRQKEKLKGEKFLHSMKLIEQSEDDFMTLEESLGIKIKEKYNTVNLDEIEEKIIKSYLKKVKDSLIQENNKVKYYKTYAAKIIEEWTWGEYLTGDKVNAIAREIEKRSNKLIRFKKKDGMRVYSYNDIKIISRVLVLRERECSSMKDSIDRMIKEFKEGKFC